MASTKKLSAIITIGGAVASSLKNALGSTSTKLKGIGGEIQKLERSQKHLSGAIQTFGRMGKNVDAMRVRYGQLTTTLQRLRAEQERVNRQQQRSERAQAARGKLTAIGATATAAGAVIGAPIAIGAKEAKHYETEKGRVAALGLGKEETEKAIKFAKDMKAFGVSQLGRLELMRDAMSVFGDEHHAEMVLDTLGKMKFGNSAVFGGDKGTQNSQAFMDMLKVIETRGGLKSKEEFNKQANIIQKVISATGGVVGATEWRHFLMQAGIIGKGMNSEALFYSMEHMVQEMGGDRAGTGLNSLYKSLYQGTNKTRNVRNMEKLGLIGDKSKVIHDKTGQTSKMDPGALLGASQFISDPFAWMNDVLLPQLAKHGITEKQKVLDTFGMIASNSVGTQFLAEMYLQREIMERKRLTNAKAMDINQLVEQGKTTADGKQLEAEARLADLKLRMGNAILPLYSAALEKAASAMERMNKFAEANPEATKAIVIGLGALAGVLAIGGPLLIGLAVIPTIVSGAAAALPLLGGAVTAVGSALTAVGAFMLANPIGLIIAGIATAAFLIYKNWDPIRDWAVSLWQDITATFNKALEWITKKIEWVGDKWAKTKEFFGFGDDVTVTPGSVSAPGAGPSLPEFKKLPPIPAFAAGNGKPASTVNDNSQTTLQIYQQPGQSQDALADDIMRRLKQQQGTRQRSIMYDTAQP